MRTIVVLFAVVACALAGPGGFPQSCIDSFAEGKKCFEGQLQGKVDIKIEEVKKCFESCPHTKGEGKGEGRGKGGEHPKSKDSSAKGGNWEQFKESFKAVRECMDGKIGDKMEQCVKSKISFAVATAPKEAKGGPGGRHGKGGRGGFRGGNPLKTLKDKVAKCGAETETCVRTALGQWYDKIDELSGILCEASKACKPSNDQCKTDLKSGKAARCACKAQLSAEFTQARTECTPAEAKDAIERMGQRAGAKGKGKGERHDDCDDSDDDSSEEEHEKKNPFCDA